MHTVSSVIRWLELCGDSETCRPQESCQISWTRSSWVAGRERISQINLLKVSASKLKQQAARGERDHRYTICCSRQKSRWPTASSRGVAFFASSIFARRGSEGCQQSRSPSLTRRVCSRSPHHVSTSELATNGAVTKKYQARSRKKVSGRRFKTRSVVFVEAGTFLSSDWKNGTLWLSRTSYNSFEAKIEILKFAKRIISLCCKITDGHLPKVWSNFELQCWN